MLSVATLTVLVSVVCIVTFKVTKNIFFSSKWDYVCGKYFKKKYTDKLLVKLLVNLNFWNLSLYNFCFAYRTLIIPSALQVYFERLNGTDWTQNIGQTTFTLTSVTLLHRDMLKVNQKTSISYIEKSHKKINTVISIYT